MITGPLAGVVAEYEEREAARFALLTWPQYWDLTRRERLLALAHYVVHNIVEHHINEAIDEEIDRRSRRR